jgi:hypothetical protein
MAGPSARLIGVVAGVAALVVIGIDGRMFTSGMRVVLGLFMSGVGVVIAALTVFWIAAGLAALIEPAHATRNASFVAIAESRSLSSTWPWLRLDPHQPERRMVART